MAGLERVFSLVYTQKMGLWKVEEEMSRVRTMGQLREYVGRI
jgi:hypothetical protein